MMNENHHKNHLRKRHSHDHDSNTHIGFLDKFIKDVCKIYNSEKHEIKFKNDKPEKSRAYEPTEVHIKI